MKKLLFAALVAGSLIACNSDGTEAEPIEAIENTTDSLQNVVEENADSIQTNLEQTSDSIKNQVEEVVE